jgi:hypothetical protein
MSDADDLSIQSIIRTACRDVEIAASRKLNRDLIDRERHGIELLVNTEHFWARAEEALMFIRFNDADRINRMLAHLSSKYDSHCTQNRE